MTILNQITIQHPYMEISKTEFAPIHSYNYEPCRTEEFEEMEYVNQSLIEAIGGTDRDWITVFQLSGDGSNAEIIIGLSGQTDTFFKVTCSMTVPVYIRGTNLGWQAWVFSFLCNHFVDSGRVFEDTICKINQGRRLLGIEPWTIESARADYFFS
jgi:hypothetical protein